MVFLSLRRCLHFTSDTLFRPARRKRRGILFESAEFTGLSRSHFPRLLRGEGKYFF